MRIVSGPELQDWLEQGTVLEKDSRGPKVVLLQNSLILKIFHTRRHPWFARATPPAQRFAKNARILHDLFIPAPNVVETLWLDRAKGLSACIYEPLPGISLETLLKDKPNQMEDLIPAFASFVLKLHRQGIYFRSLHLGNVLFLPEGGFGLIDFLDLHKTRRRLSSWQAKRNLEHLQRYLQRRKIPDFPIDRLIQNYNTAAQACEQPSNNSKQ